MHDKRIKMKYIIRLETNDCVAFYSELTMEEVLLEVMDKDINMIMDEYSILHAIMTGYIVEIKQLKENLI